jgi:hypothetical protein
MEKRHKAYESFRLSELELRPPTYVHLFGRLPVLRIHHPMFCVFICAAILVGAYDAVRLIARHQQTLNEALIIYLGSAVTVLGIVLLISGYEQVKDAVHQFAEVLEGGESRRRLASDLDAVTGRTQDIFAVAFCVLGLVLLTLLGPQVPVPWLVFVVGVGAAVFLVSGYGLGFAVMTIRLIHSLPAYGRMRMSILPAKTPALRALSGVTSVLALYFSIQLLCESLLCLAIHWKNHWALDITVYSFLLPISGLAALLFVYPQLGIWRLVQSHKQDELGVIDSALDAINMNSVATFADHNEVARISRLLELRRRIQESPSLPIDTATAARVLASLILPALGSLVQHAATKYLPIIVR